MIYYFSGTGNSKWVAEQLALLTADTVTNISTLLGNGTVAGWAGKDTVIGLVFPIYAWGAPRIVEDFIRSFNMEQGTYAYAVCTCGDDAGCAMKRLKKIFPWQSAWSVPMPNNYIPMYDVDAPELMQKKLAFARDKLPIIAQTVKARAFVTDVHTGGMAGLKTWLINPIFNQFAMTTRPFTVDVGCTGCGLCADNCPVNAIQIAQGKPTWVKKRCCQCMACIQRCPVRTIQYGAGTRTRGRYYFEKE